MKIITTIVAYVCDSEMTRGCKYWTGLSVPGTGRIMCCVGFPNLAFGGRKRKKGVVTGRRKRASLLQRIRTQKVVLVNRIFN